MDLSKFLEDDFDVKDWINNAFRAHKEGNNDQYATNIVMRLQMVMQEFNNVIEDCCQQTVTNLPRVMKEAEAVKQEATMLHEQMKMVKYDIQKVEHNTAKSMQMLLELDAVKMRMKAASEALREADNWTTLSADVEDVFESQDIDAMSKKIVGMQQSLHILTDVPDFAERCSYLESLKNRLEAMLSPHIVAAFSSQSLDSAQKFARIFNDIERFPQLCKYYQRCHKSNLHNAWKQIHQQSPDGSVMTWLTEFYDQLLSTWNTQMKWCSQVFGDSITITSDLLSETLGGLDPSIVSCVDRMISASNCPIDDLITIRKITDQFAVHLETAISSHGTGSLYLPSVDRMAQSIYAPFRVYTSKFCQLEDDLLRNALDNIRLDHEDVMDCVTLLGESVPKLFAAAAMANQHCIDLTSGCGYVMLPRVLQDYLKKYLIEFERVLVNISEKCKVDPSTGMDTDEWDSFQNSLRIIQACGDLIMHLDELDQSLISNVVTTVGRYCVSTGSLSHKESLVRSELKRNPFRDYRQLLLQSVDSRQALELLITRLEEGDSPSMMDEAKEQVYALCRHVHKFSFDIVFAPLQQHLTLVPNMQVWKSGITGSALTPNLPNFSLTPQEYITKIGQYLMTLPQQLEPFTMENNPMLTVAIKYGKLPYIGDIGELPEHLAQLWLESVARGCMQVYADQILKIPELAEPSTKQLVTDIDYLTNVLDDLGLETSEVAKNLVLLLNASQEEYAELSENMPQRLSSAVANMRGLRVD